MAQNIAGWTNSESWMAKFVFVVVMLVVFFFLLRVALMLTFYLVPTVDSPYLVSGILEGSRSIEIKQDPRADESKVVARSRNQMSGIEFSWGVWLYVDEQPLQSSNTSEEFVVFSKGEPLAQCAPSLIVGREKMTSGANSTSFTGSQGEARGSDSAYLRVRMETYDSNENDGTASSIADVKVNNLPMKRWVHVCIRLQNTALDIYINGNATRRAILPAVPKQNYGSVFVFPTKTNTTNSNMAGYLSDLVYYPYALNPYRLNALVVSGPSTQPSVYSATAMAKTAQTDFLGSSWYASQRA